MEQASWERKGQGEEQQVRNAGLLNWPLPPLDYLDVTYFPSHTIGHQGHLSFGD